MKQYNKGDWFTLQCDHILIGTIKYLFSKVTHK